METLFEANRKRLFLYLVRSTGDPDLARDILQECFTRCMERYEARDLSPALLFTMARNALIDHVRRDSRRVSLEEDCPDETADPERSLMMRDRCAKVFDALMRLSPQERDILSMVISSDLSYTEIAEVMSLSVANVKVKVHRARIRLKDYLED